MIVAQNLKKNYGNFSAVNDLSFSIPEGEIVGLLGPNGAGKTTTMRILTTFIHPTSGSAQIAGFDIKKDSLKIRKQIGYLPETPPLYPEMKVEDYLSFVADLKSVESRHKKQFVKEAIESCGLGNVKDKLCGDLSKGYKQRVGIAQAIVHKPKVIILDEPTSGLDPQQIIEIRKFIKQLQGKHTVILSTHILPEVSETCNRVIVISAGQIILDGNISDITKDSTLEECFLAAISKS